MAADFSHSEPKTPERVRRGACLVLSLAAALLVLMRLHAFGLPLEPDECNYAYIGQRLLAGDRLYVDVWDHQPPAVFALFAATSATAGSDTGVFRLMSMAFSLVSLSLVYVIVRRVNGPFLAGAGAFAFALISSDPGTAGEGCNREIYMNTFGLAALVALGALNGSGGPRFARREYALIALAGLLLAIGSAFKTVVAVQWLALLAWVLWRQWRLVPEVRPAISAALAFGAGPALIWTLLFSYFTATGRFGALYEAVFAYNIDYAGAKTSWLGRFAAFLVEGWHRDIFTPAAPLWIASALALPVSLVLGLREARRPRVAPTGPAHAAAIPTSRRATVPQRTTDNASATTRRPPTASSDSGLSTWHLGLILAYVLGSFVAVCLPGHSWPHYYYLLVPPLVILVAVTIATLTRIPSGQKFSLYALQPQGRTGRILAVVWVVWLAGWQAWAYLSVPVTKLTETRYESRDWWGRAQGLNVAEVTEPGDTVLVIGADPGVYFYSGRRAATRYTMMAALTSGYPGFEQRRRNLMEDLQRFRPRLILIIDPAFPELERFIKENYVQAAPGLQFVDMHDLRPTEWVMQAVMDVRRPVRPIDWNWHRAFLNP
jgi:hypothetical protein